MPGDRLAPIPFGDPLRALNKMQSLYTKRVVYKKGEGGTILRYI